MVIKISANSMRPTEEELGEHRPLTKSQKIEVTELKNTITELKYALEGFNNRLTEEESE